MLLIDGNADMVKDTERKSDDITSNVEHLQRFMEKSKISPLPATSSNGDMWTRRAPTIAYVGDLTTSSSQSSAKERSSTQRSMRSSRKNLAGGLATIGLSQPYYVGASYPKLASLITSTGGP